MKISYLTKSIKKLRIYALICAILFTVCFSSACAQEKKQRSLTELFDAAKGAIATISTSGDSAATAFAIRKTPDALYAVTNLHPFNNKNGGTEYPLTSIIFFNGESADIGKGEAALIGYNAYHDIAVIRIKSTSAAYGVEPLAFRESAVPTAGAPLFAIGNSSGMGLALFDGIVSIPERALTLSAYNKTVPVIQVTVPVNGGSSGCPVLDYDGKVTGIGAYQSLYDAVEDRPAIGMSYCVPAAVAVPLIDRIIASNPDGTLPAGETASMDVKLVHNAETNYTINFGMYGFTGVFKNNTIEITFTDASLSELTNVGEMLKAGDKITAFGSLDVSKCGLAELIGHTEKYFYSTMYADGKERIQIKFTRGGTQYTFTHQRVYKY